MVRIESRKKIASSTALSSSAASKKKARAKANARVSFANSLAGIAGSSSTESVEQIEEAHENETKIAAREAIADISMLAIQEQSANDQQKNARRKAIELGGSLLNRLEELNVRLISGVVSDDKLIQLKQFFAQKREHVQDDRLHAILAEIDLRVQVEIAKKRK